MEGFITSIISGFSHVVGKLLGHPLDFLSGKSCNTKCLPIWDVFCYIENFCISHLLKLVLVIVLLYFILLFFYLSFKLGICHCICSTCCRSIWACFGMYFYMLEYCCSFFCLNLDKHNRRRHVKRTRDIEEEFAVYSDDNEDWERSTNYSGMERDTEVKRRKISESPKRTGRDIDIDIDIDIERRKRLGYRARGKERKEYLRRALRPKKHHRILVRRLSRGDSFCSRQKNWIKNNNDYYYGISPVNNITFLRSSKFAQKRGSFRSLSNLSRNKNVNMY